MIFAALVVSGIGLSSKASAQGKGSRAIKSTVKPDSTKPPLSDDVIGEIKRMIQARKAGTLAPSDPCANADPITLSQPVNGDLANTDCILTDGRAIDYYDFHGTAGQPVFISETSNTLDTYLYLFDDTGQLIDYNDDSGATTDSRIPLDGGVMILPYTGDYFIGASSYDPVAGSYTLTVDTDQRCTATSLMFNQTNSGTLTTSSCAVNINDQPYWTNLYTFSGTAGQQVSVTMSSGAVDAYLVFHTPSGLGSLEDDDSGGGTDARVPGSGTFTLPETGVYTIEASTSGPAAVGAYTLNLTGPAAAPVSVTGRVVTSDGRGLRNATVSFVDSFGVTRITTTSPFGFYSFDNVLTNNSYTFRVSSRLFRFTPQIVSVSDNETLPDFVGQE